MKIKRRFLRIVVFIFAFLCVSVNLTGCSILDFFSCNKTSENNDSPSTWIIQYTNDEGTHQLNVADGMPFALEKIPKREGYDFLGLFDSEVGGTQYVSSSGASLTTFTDKRNIVLFPQWLAKKYTLLLNYGKAPDAGIDSVEVRYDEEIQDLPENFYLEGSEFIGWYNTQDASGTKFANGTVMNKSLAVLADENNRISLNAVFNTAKYTVRFYSYDGNSLIEEKQVEHGSNILDVAPKTLSDGSEITEWSMQPNGRNKFTGEITSEGKYYVSDYRYVVTLNYGYGNQKQVIRVSPGGSCTLPDLVRPRYTFNGWYENEMKVDEQYTPERSITLSAKWTANFYTVTFNSNGGSTVAAREVERGGTIDLPSASRVGYIFNYWKTSSGTQVSSPYKPTSDITLYADWTVIPAEVVFNSTIRTGSHKINGSGHYTTDTFTLTKDLETMRAMGFSKLSVTVNYDIKEVDNCYQYVYLYDSESVSIWSEKIEHGGGSKDKNWGTHSFTCEISLSSLKSNVWTFKCQAQKAIFKDFYIGTVSVTVTAMP